MTGSSPTNDEIEFTPLEIMPRCSAAELDFKIIPVGFIPFRDKSLTGFNSPLGFESQRLEFLTGQAAGLSNGVNQTPTFLC